MRIRGLGWALGVVLLFSLSFAQHADALDDEHWNQAHQAIKRGIEYLRTTQNEDGSWSPQAGPAVTALIVRSMLQQPDISPNDPQVAKAIEYILSKVQDDGGIYDTILPNYNTAICLSALVLVNDQPRVAEVIANAQRFLISLQWHDQSDPDGQPVNESHPFYGGAGYGKHGRPDMSNTQIMLQGLYDSGLDCNDPAFQRALVFITRCQGTASNTEFADQIVPDGGFIYATSVNKEQIGQAMSQAGEITLDDPATGLPTNRLRTYGSMTYAGLKSYVYADLDRNDPRVVDAVNWVRNNYTFDANPGMPEQLKLHGYFYYLMTKSRALRAWGSTYVATPTGRHDWANDLVSKLAMLQADDGSWVNEVDRWMEADVNLVTGYALIALTEAIR